MNINKLRDKIHETAKEKGFYDAERYIDVLPSDLIDKNAVKHAFFAQKIALIHSEISEALEADRKGKHSVLGVDAYSQCFDKKSFEMWVKDTVEDELADAIIRILDLAGWMKIDIEKHVRLKIKYNSTREFKHGKAY